MAVQSERRPNQLVCTNSLRLVEDEEDRREEAEARRLIRLHLLHSGFAPDCSKAGNADWNVGANNGAASEQLITTKGRRAGTTQAVNGFVKDVIAGLESNTFVLAHNIDQGDERRGLDDERADEISRLMKDKGCNFDDARLEIARQRMRDAGVDPDTGLPLDPKALLPSDCPDTRKLSPQPSRRSPPNSKAATARAMISKLWGSG